MILQSFQNEKIKHLVHLHNKNYRYQHQEFIAQGFKTCASLLQAGYNLKAIYFTQEMYQQHQDDFLITETFLVTDAIMKTISTTTTPMGIVGIFAVPQAQAVSNNNAIMLYKLQDPGNVGTLIRSASAMNVDTIYCVDSVDIYNPKVVQATAGCFGKITMIQCNYQEFLDQTKELSTCALVARDGKSPDQEILKSSILVIGNEGQGLDEEVIKNCSHTMTLPMPGNIESLNAAVAGSIAMYLKSEIK